MKSISNKLASQWGKLSPRFLPFADAATDELPLGRLLRLSLFQFTVGMAIALLIGTLNRVMIVELGVSAWLVAVMVSLPLIFAPFRAIIGFKSDNYKSHLGWKRVPYIWLGTMMQFGGFAIMPMALLLLSGDTTGPEWIGDAAAALAFLMVGIGLHTVQTVGLALATDLAPPQARPKVVALMCMMLLVGVIVSSVVFGLLLANFTPVKLIQVVQGAALVTLLFNSIALWKQEARDPNATTVAKVSPTFRTSWAAFTADRRSKRHLVAIGLGTAAFSMEDILLEPFGGQILQLSVATTTLLTALLGIGSAVGLWLAARLLGRGADPHRVASFGLIAGLAAFSMVTFSAPLKSGELFALGTLFIGFGAGLFAHGTLTATMALARKDDTGLALGAWGAVQATTAGLAIAAGGIICDAVNAAGAKGMLGAAMADPSTGYLVVYHIEIAFLFASLVAIGPLVRAHKGTDASSAPQFDLVPMSR